MIFTADEYSQFEDVEKWLLKDLAIKYKLKFIIKQKEVTQT